MSAVCDDPNLVSCGGLAPVVALGQRCGLAELVAAKLTLSAKGSANAHVKIPALIAGMVAGPTRSMTWTYCGAAGWSGCSPVSTPVHLRDFPADLDTWNVGGSDGR
jgi:hypothetical protein